MCLLLFSMPLLFLPHPEADELRKTWGRNELEEKKIPSWFIFMQQARGGGGCTLPHGAAVWVLCRVLPSPRRDALTPSPPLSPCIGLAGRLLG